jgi:hypothetical protein
MVSGNFPIESTSDRWNRDVSMWALPDRKKLTLMELARGGTWK